MISPASSNTTHARLYQKTLPPLDGLRGIAALLVVGLHGAFNWIPGRVGVLIFFVLSGFLITRLLLAEQELTSAVSLKRFYLRRALRIFPAFYTFWVLYLLVYRPQQWAGPTASFLYISNYWLAWAPWAGAGIAHTWSLSVEEQFYLLWPWLFVWQRHHIDRLLVVLVALITLSAVWKIVLIYALRADPEYVHMAFDTRCSDILVGCALALLVHRRPVLPLWMFQPIALAFPVGVLVLAGYLDAVGEHAFDLAAIYTPAAIATAVLMVQVVVMGEIWPLSALSTPPMRYLGSISYPMYLYHGMVILLVDRWAVAHYSVRIALIFALTIVAGTLSYVLIERPFLRLRNRVT